MNCRKAAVSVIAAAGVIIIFAGFLLVYAGGTQQVLKITPEEYDFGTINEGDPAIVTATVQNVGSASVEITNVRTS
jgi:uncharacterized membrane protein